LFPSIVSGIMFLTSIGYDLANCCHAIFGKTSAP
jgi:hypothetical protein